MQILIPPCGPTCADYDCLVRQAGRDVNRDRDSVHAAYQFKQSQLGKHFAIDVCTRDSESFAEKHHGRFHLPLGLLLKQRHLENISPCH